ncbi:hypothetical protein [Streptomyces sp. NPDC094049]|uniref:hypothetical protein n=1 Tax=Streptomyces sp. NPDC094049 TaxID=3154987 RepID=UPI003330B124
MVSPGSFRHASWSSSSYGLGIETGTTDDAGLQAVLGAVWEAAGVQGCFGDGDREPEEQEPVPLTVAALAEFGRLHGRARMPAGQWMACSCTVVRGGGGSDWLDFDIPLSALDLAGVAYGDGRPFFRSAVMDDWLAAIGIASFERARFSLGVIGWEVSGTTDAATVAGEMPPKRGIGYLVPHDGALHYGAAND